MSFNPPKYYADVNLKQDLSYHDYENLELTFGLIFNLVTKKNMKSAKKLAVENTVRFSTVWTLLRMKRLLSKF